VTLADHIAAQTAARVTRAIHAPTGWEPGVRFEDSEPVEVTLALQEIPADEQAWRDEIKRVTTLDIPPQRRVEIQQVRYWGNPQEPMVYVRFGIHDRTAGRDDVDYPTLLRIARANRHRPPKQAQQRTRVVVVSDCQIGKVDHRGGRQEFLDRVETALAGLGEVIRAERCEDVLIVDPGDLTEGFENTAQQAHTNDLSFPDQLDLAQVVLTEMVSQIAARHARTRVVTVPSNHGAWRRGKDRLGRPGDDFGILTHKAVARVLAGREDVAFLIPDPWQESLSVQVRGAVVGVAHGHQVNRPDRVPDWWASQTHGDSPLAAATILITGHFHSLRIQPTGAAGGRSKWWVQAPTLDNGSAWYANAQGSDSDSGLVTFTIDDAGAWDRLRFIAA